MSTRRVLFASDHGGCAAVAAPAAHKRAAAAHCAATIVAADAADDATAAGAVAADTVSVVQRPSRTAAGHFVTLLPDDYSQTYNNNNDNSNSKKQKRNVTVGTASPSSQPPLPSSSSTAAMTSSIAAAAADTTATTLAAMAQRQLRATATDARLPRVLPVPPSSCASASLQRVATHLWRFCEDERPATRTQRAPTRNTHSSHSDGNSSSNNAAVTSTRLGSRCDSRPVTRDSGCAAAAAAAVVSSTRMTCLQQQQQQQQSPSSSPPPPPTSSSLASTSYVPLRVGQPAALQLLLPQSQSSPTRTRADDVAGWTATSNACVASRVYAVRAHTTATTARRADACTAPSPSVGAAQLRSPLLALLTLRDHVDNENNNGDDGDGDDACDGGGKDKAAQPHVGCATTTTVGHDDYTAAAAAATEGLYIHDDTRQPQRLLPSSVTRRTHATTATRRFAGDGADSYHGSSGSSGRSGSHVSSHSERRRSSSGSGGRSSSGSGSSVVAQAVTSSSTTQRDGGSNARLHRRQTTMMTANTATMANANATHAMSPHTRVATAASALFARRLVHSAGVFGYNVSERERLLQLCTALQDAELQQQYAQRHPLTDVSVSPYDVWWATHMQDSCYSDGVGGGGGIAAVSAARRGGGVGNVHPSASSMLQRDVSSRCLAGGRCGSGNSMSRRRLALQQQQQRLRQYTVASVYANSHYYNHDDHNNSSSSHRLQRHGHVAAVTLPQAVTTMPPTLAAACDAQDALARRALQSLKHAPLHTLGNTFATDTDTTTATTAAAATMMTSSSGSNSATTASSSTMQLPRQPTSEAETLARIARHLHDDVALQPLLDAHNRALQELQMLVEYAQGGGSGGGSGGSGEGMDMYSSSREDTASIGGSSVSGGGRQQSSHRARTPTAARRATRTL